MKLATVTALAMLLSAGYAFAGGGVRYPRCPKVARHRVARALS